MNTTGWNLTGNAHVGNISSNDNSELILCTTGLGQTGGAFYNQPIDLSKCNQWKAEFDFRMYDGNAADGIAFCFLTVPPSGFVSGKGVGIPDVSDGLKVVFDTYNNCLDKHDSLVPKIELRWGQGYNECSDMPTHNNSGGDLSFIRSENYKHAIITYNAGNIVVSVNGKEYLTGFQPLSLTGYMGFTAGTGGQYDNHSIKNAIIYTNQPTTSAGSDVAVCAGQTVQIGSSANDLYTYQWSPSEGLSSATDAQPVAAIANATDSDISRVYAVTASLADGSGCAATDSVRVTIKTLAPPAISIRSPVEGICSNDDPPLFTSTVKAAGTAPRYDWMINGDISGTNSDTFSAIRLSDGDIVTCRLTNAEGCAEEKTAVSNAIRISVYPSPDVEAGNTVTIDYGSTAQLQAAITGEVQSIVWTPAAGLSNPRTASPVASPRRTILYTIRVTNGNGCAASDTLRVKVISKGVSVPSAFSPNGDGENDIFKPVVLGYAPVFSFTVYNRWGQKVYRSNVQDAGWDGTSNGNKQPAGTYTWIVSCTLDTNVPVRKSGTVVLIR